MCRLQPRPTTNGRDDATNANRKQSSFGKISAWPLPTWILIAILPLLPTSFYLNRGYTVWFHLISLSYALTRSPFVRKVLVLQGAGICLGWYAAILNDWFVEGTFCHTLYRNMPASMLEHMVVEGGGVGSGSYVILDTYSSYGMKVASHVLDTLGHPGLAYLFWRLHRRSGGTLKDTLTWPVILFAWHLSRVWSLVHSYHNNGTLAFWYYGHEVYLMNNLDSYLIAYAAEGACFVAAIALRLYWDRSEGQSMPLSSSLPPVKKTRDEEFYHEISKQGRERAPGLVHSESAASASSMM